MLPRVSVQHRLINLLYPQACLLCHLRLDTPETGTRLEGPLLCPACQAALIPNRPPLCLRCGLGLSGAFDARLACRRCATQPPPFESARAPWQYTGLVRQAIRQFKYHRRWRLGRWLADEMVQAAGAAWTFQDIAMVVPVPLHWLKRWLKGFNPAAHLAAPVARALGKPCVPGALRRTRWTATQTRLAGRARRRNVRGAFTAQARWVRDRTVLLVDDVLTSGATAGACASALKAAGATRVLVLTAARTPLP